MPFTSPSTHDSTPGGLNCTNCGRFVKFQPCKSDKNGNKGVLFATCHSINDKGVQCSFIRRASRSPSGSPPISHQPTFPSSPPPFASPVAPAAGKCPIAGCGQTRLADDCPRRICRKHCIMQGGCASKTHKPSDVTSGATTMKMTTAVSPALPTTPTAVVSPPSTLTAPSFRRSPSLEVIDARPDPRFATHLRPVFTEVIAKQQENLQQQNMLDAEKKEKAQKAKQRIAVYPWTAENTPPTVKLFQDFTWPHLTITSSLLVAVGLLDASVRGDLRMFDEKEILDWVSIDVGYIVEVCEGQRLFLKDASIRNCADFQKALDNPPQVSSHLHHHLARERAYVREMHKVMPPPPRQPSNTLATFSQQYSLPCSPSPSLSSAQSTPSLPPTPLSAPSPSVTLEPTVLPCAPVTPPASHNSNIQEGPSNLTVVGDGDERRWPVDYFTVDIGNCMRECSSRTHRIHQRSETQRNVFAKYFCRVRFVPSTFSNQRDLWHRASSSLQDEFMELGRCKEGLWSVFAKRARLEQKLKAMIAE